jgi:hypothetical protein
MIRQLFIMLLFSLPSVTFSQGMKASGHTIEELVPEGWTHQETFGDLNKDGLIDLVIIATPNNPENIKKREDGYEYNFNQPILGVYFRTKEGVYSCWKLYPEMIPARPDEYVSIDPTIKITDRQVLVVDLDYFASAGSYGTTNYSFLFRFQKGDFYLIGEDERQFSRNTGESEVISKNYLTYKQQRITSNEFDTTVKKREQWKKLPHSPLRKMGTWTLGD